MLDPIRQSIANFAKVFVGEPTPAASKDPVPVPASRFQVDAVQLGGTFPAAKEQLAGLAALAERESAGQRPDGRSYAHVWSFIERVGFGNMPAVGIPDTHAMYARQFAEYADKNLQQLGLKKLPLDNPYKAPPGAIVVMAPGAPGTAHPIAGDIAVRTEKGFGGGGEVTYGGPNAYPPGNPHVLGVYVPGP